VAERIDITCPSGVKLWAKKFTGKVVSSKLNQTTDIHQTSSRFVPGYGAAAGTVIPGQVYSTTSSSREVWLLDEAGHEEQFHLSDKVALREGHDLSVVWGGHESTGNYLYVKNHTTGELYDVRTATIRCHQPYSFRPGWLPVIGTICFAIWLYSNASSFPQTKWVLLPVYGIVACLLHLIVSYAQQAKAYNKTLTDDGAYALEKFKEFVMK
jgi:hypothetical protein